MRGDVVADELGEILTAENVVTENVVADILGVERMDDVVAENVATEISS